MGKRVLFAYGLGLAGVALTVGLTLGAFALAGSGLSQPAAPIAPTSRSIHTPSQADGGAGEGRNQPHDDPTRSPGRGGEGEDHGGSSSGESGGEDRAGSSSSGSDDSGSSEGSGSDGGSGTDDNSGSGSSDDGGSDDNSGSGGESGSGSDDSGDD